MNRPDLLLAALSAAGKGVQYEPVQVQKLFFLIDTEISNLVGGPHFDFQPYDYGPFDSAVYSELEALQARGLVAIEQGYYRHYALTDGGYERGAKLLEAMNAGAREFLCAAAKWVRSLSFSELVSAIYKKYPPMRKNSIFRE
jgi:uncharacterized protein YwgA